MDDQKTLKLSNDTFLDENIDQKVEECPSGCELCVLENYLDPHWKEMLKDEIAKPYFTELKKKLHCDSIIYPPIDEIFTFSRYFKPSETKVVILGQDPYCKQGQAMGLSFSVNEDQDIPPSLENIFKEIKSNYSEYTIPVHGSLINWAEQGILLLDDSLTVVRHEPRSHSEIGWSQFTDAIISLVNKECQNVVFMLWGYYAKGKGMLIDWNDHLILTSSHPSPKSAHVEFFGCQHFLKANEYLLKHGKEPIKW